MCTVSVITLPGLLRLVANRDEQRTRPTALPPSLTRAGHLRVLAPTDPVSQGTWIACNEIGLAIALLNVNPADAAGVNPPDAAWRVPPRSRGGIIPGLIHSRSLDEVAALAAAIDREEYSPFRLVAVQAGDGEILVVPPAAGEVHRLSLSEPQMFTSSGLGDAQVEGPRRQLFDEMVTTGRFEDVRARQDRFHAQRWRDRPEVSVHMSRAEAWTVSRTAIAIDAERVVMSYAAEPDWTAVVTALPRRA
jgi:hypothetical protein